CSTAVALSALGLLVFHVFSLRIMPGPARSTLFPYTTLFRSMDEAFMLASFPKREDHRDAFISRDGKTLKDLPEGAVVGTSSARRAAFIHAYYPHLKTEPIRGPVDKRLEQLREGKYDGIILAVAGLKRLDLEHVITEYLPEDKLTPAAGQAALAIECRSDDHEVIKVVRKIND